MTREVLGLFYFKFRLRYHKDKESPRVRSARSQRGRTDDKFANEEIWFSILSGLGPTINPEDEKEKVKNPKLKIFLSVIANSRDPFGGLTTTSGVTGFTTTEGSTGLLTDFLKL